MMSNSPLPTTLRLTDKPNEPIRNLKPISTSSVPTTLNPGCNPYRQLNSTITLHCIALPRGLHSPSSMVMNLAPTPPLGKTFLSALKNRLSSLDETQKEALATHESARKLMTQRSFHQFVPWKIGDKVWLEATHLCLHYPSRKLASKCMGPFEITRVLSSLTYQLKLPHTWKIHDVFHASLLSPYHSTEAHGPSFLESPPDVIDNEEEYEVKAILSHKGPKSCRKYLTSWKGYSTAENTWEPKSNLRHSASILSSYKRQHNL